MCWRNAIMALVELPGWEYVEGWVSGGLILTEHGWVQNPETGAIVETTPSYLDTEDDLQYHPGRVYTHAAAMKAAVGEGVTLPIDPGFDMGFVTPDLMEAYREAHTAQYGEKMTRWVFEKVRTA